VTDKHRTPDLERTVTRVEVTTDAELLPAVVDFVRQVAHRLDLRDRAAEHLDVAVEAVCRNVVEHAFDSDEAGQYDVEQRS
jgi:anti-sigma regulatory factor (Ser/Thr protein kinase)